MKENLLRAPGGGSNANLYDTKSEKQMADLKENIENETQSSQDAYLRMDAHISLYFTEMEQFL